jgi:signal transduction histidine kinase
MVSRQDRTAAPLPFWAWCLLALLCAGLYTAAVPITSAVYELDLVVAFVLATVQCGSLLLAVSHPRSAAVLQIASVAALAVATRDGDGAPWPLPVTGLVSLGVLLLLLGIRERWQVSVIAWWVSVVALVAIIALSPARYAVPDQWGVNLTVYATYTATVLVAAIALGQRRRIRADLARARRDVELEQARRQSVEDRAMIARELHDVVAHSMSLVHMRALSAPMRLRGAGQAEVDEEFGRIALSARSALREMRQLLGTLRAGNDAELAPQPQLHDIPALVDATRHAGLPIEADTGAAASGASPVVQLTTYRLIQEALSNVVRHAPGARTTVTVTAEGSALHITVHNEPAARAAVSPVDTGGHGLRGMRERVALLGGELTTHPTPEGGYLVAASIPAALAPGEREST